MSPVVCYLGLGSNLSHPVHQIDCAIDQLNQIEQIQCIAISPYYQSKPHGSVTQDDFINAVIQVSTLLSPTELLKKTQHIEQQAKRVKTIHWGPRTLDIDIVLYGNLTISTPELVIPHPYATQREFVIKPLWDLNNTLQFPNGLKINDLLNTLSINTLTQIKHGKTFNTQRTKK